MRASAGSCRTHPGRGKLLAVRVPPSGCGLPTLRAMISPVRSPEPRVFSAIDQVVSPGCTVWVGSGRPVRTVTPTGAAASELVAAAPTMARSTVAAALIGTDSGGRVCAAAMFEPTAPVTIMNSSTDAVLCAHPIPLIRGRVRPARTAGISSTSAAIMTTQATAPIRTRAPMNNRPVSGPSRASQTSPSDGRWSGIRSLPTAHRITGAPTTNSRSPTSPTTMFTRRLMVIPLRRRCGQGQLARCRAPSAG